MDELLSQSERQEIETFTASLLAELAHLRQAKTREEAFTAFNDAEHCWSKLEGVIDAID